MEDAVLPVLKTIFRGPANKKFLRKSKNAQNFFFFVIINCKGNSYFTGNVPGNGFVLVKLFIV